MHQTKNLRRVVLSTSPHAGFFTRSQGLWALWATHRSPFSVLPIIVKCVTHVLAHPSAICPVQTPPPGQGEGLESPQCPAALLTDEPRQRFFASPHLVCVASTNDEDENDRWSEQTDGLTAESLPLTR